jgi:hypothetical protein
LPLFPTQRGRYPSAEWPASLADRLRSHSATSNARAGREARRGPPRRPQARGRSRIATQSLPGGSPKRGVPSSRSILVEPDRIAGCHTMERLGTMAENRRRWRDAARFPGRAGKRALHRRNQFETSRMSDYNDHLDQNDGVIMGTTSWTVAEAKAKFSQVLEQARTAGPQTITRSGKLAEEWARKTQRVGNLAEFFAQSPLRGSGLKLRRPRGGARPIKL